MALSIVVEGDKFHLSGNPIRVWVNGATIPPGASDYKVLLKVTSLDGKLLGSPFIDAIAPISGTAKFDISGWVDQPLEKEFEWPLTGGLNPYPDQTLDIKMGVGYRYIDENNELVEQWESETETHYIIKGGVSFRSLGIYNDTHSHFYLDFVGKKFLTRMPDRQVVHPFQPVKLWFLAAESGYANLAIKAYYEDNSYYEIQNSHTFYVNILHEINVLPYHADAVNLAPVKAGNIKMLYYEVWIEGLTGKFTFAVDHSYHENCNYILFANSLGGVDVFWCCGHVKKEFTSEKVEAIKPWPVTGTSRDRTVIISSRIGKNAWKINTGWKSRTEMEALSDLLNSRQAWLLEDAASYNGGTLYPVMVANSNSKLFDSQNDAQSLELDLVEGHNNNYI